MNLLIKNGKIVDFMNKQIIENSILIQDGKITKIDNTSEIINLVNSYGTQVNVIDAADKYVFPGLIDAHTHMREPGFEDKETIETGTMAAARGGFTTIFAMPNTSPVTDNRAIVESIVYKAERRGMVKVLPIGALTKGSKGEELAEYADMKEAGIIALSDDGHTIKSSAIMRNAMTYAGSLNIPVIDHCEDIELVNTGYMHEGYQSTLLGLRGIPSESEEVIVARDILLSKMLDQPIHLAHISAKGSVELIREAKKRGCKITAEVTPHHLVLTDEAVAEYDTATKCNPPLRTEEDRQALIQGLKEGVLDIVASDHAPHAREDKEVEYAYAPFGMIGLETSVSLFWDRFIHEGIMDVYDFYNMYYKKPAEIFGLYAEGLKEGAVADITIIDEEKINKIDKYNMLSKAQNTPFHGWELKGDVFATIVEGTLVMQEGKMIHDK